MPTCPYVITIASDGVAHVSGEVDETVTEHFAQEVTQLLTGHDRTLDLSSVDYLPSSAVTTLVRAMRSTELGALTLRARPGTIAHRVLWITGMPFVDAPAEQTP